MKTPTAEPQEERQRIASGTSGLPGPPPSAPPPRQPRRLWLLLLLLLLLTAGSLGTAVAIFGMPAWMGSRKASSVGQRVDSRKPTLLVELVEGMPHTLSVPEAVRKGLGIVEAEEVKPAKHGRPLVLPGSTQLDPTRLARVKCRFNAEVQELGQVPEDPAGSRGQQTVMRELRPGDVVKKGDVLAVVWSVDVGSRKSDLVDALVQLKLDEKRLKARLELLKNGSVSEDTLNQTRRDVVSDQNAADRAERTLRTWNVPEHEIQAVHEEAEQAYLRQGKRDKEKERLWARSQLIAPRDGTIVERNVGVGEYIADNTINLFTIADVNTLQVLANPPEDQLPALLALKPAERRWSLQTVGAKPLSGRIDEISYILDANQHTAVVKGQIENPDGMLRAGQFVSAVVELPPPPDTVEVPLTALAEDGKQSFVFVQSDPQLPRYTMRRVKVTHRFEKTAFVSSRLSPEDQKLSPEEARQGLQSFQPLKPGEPILTSGVLELRSALEDRESKRNPKSQIPNPKS